MSKKNDGFVSPARFPRGFKDVFVVELGEPLSARYPPSSSCTAGILTFSETLACGLTIDIVAPGGRCPGGKSGVILHY